MKAVEIEIVFDKKEDYIPRINRIIKSVANAICQALETTLKDGEKGDCGTYRYSWKTK